MRQICAVCMFLLIAVPISAELEREDAELALDSSREKVRRHMPEGALAGFRWLTRNLPPDDPISKEARVELCALRRQLERGQPPEKADRAPLELFRPPRLLVEPALPLPARPLGSLVIKVRVDRDGCIHRPRLRRNLWRNRERAILAAIETWVLAPATSSGEPIVDDFEMVLRNQH